MAAVKNIKDIWYRKGLKFRCVPGCGNCCKIPGDVWLDDTEVEKLAEFKKMTVPKFLTTYTRKRKHRFPDGIAWTLKEKTDKSCIFYMNGCTVYDARPLQCRTYPFWKEVIRSENTWNRETKECPGINTGQTHGCPSITKKLNTFKKKIYS